MLHIGPTPQTNGSDTASIVLNSNPHLSATQDVDLDLSRQFLYRPHHLTRLPPRNFVAIDHKNNRGNLGRSGSSEIGRTTARGAL